MAQVVERDGQWAVASEGQVIYVATGERDAQDFCGCYEATRAEARSDSLEREARQPRMVGTVDEDGVRVWEEEEL